MNPEAHIPLYEFEAAIEHAFRKFFEPHGFTVNTPDDFEFQRQTPRVEFQFKCGPATDHRSTHDDIYRVDSFTGVLEVRILTLAQPGVAQQPVGETPEPTNSNAYRLHSKIRAKVRYLMGRCETDFSTERDTGADSWLPLHDLNRVFPDGDDPLMQTAGDTSYLLTVSRYAIHFNIRRSAWPVVD